MGDLPFSCSCGQVKGTVAAVPSGGTHLECFCASCRAGYRYAGGKTAIDAPVDLYLTQPQHFEITQGMAQLQPFAFSPKGILRWQATCCREQMFSTQASPKTAIMSLVTERLETPAAAGPILARAFIPKSGGKAGHEGNLALLKMVMRMLVARVTGAWRKTPLYDTETLKPLVPVTLVSKEDKAALLAAKD